MCILAGYAAASCGSALGRTVEVFPQVHQRKKSAQHTGFQVVCQVQPAGRNARQPFSVFRDESHDFTMALPPRIPERGLPAHLGATGFERQGEMENAELLIREGGRYVVLASGDVAEVSHGPYSGDG